MDTRGRLIAFVGIDGAGKTTLLNSVVSLLNSNARIVKHPPAELRDYIIRNSNHDNPIENEVRYVNSLKLKEQKNMIIPELEKGNDVIADRYLFCSYSHYMKKGVDLPILINITKDILVPDLTLLISTSAENSIQRQIKRPPADDFFSSSGFDCKKINQTAKYYEDLGEIFNFRIIDNNNSSIEESAKECYKNICSIKSLGKIKTVEQFLEQKYKEEREKDNSTLYFVRNLCKNIDNHTAIE